jgi:Tfp pilus tip-associated adhesin PilY1
LKVVFRLLNADGNRYSGGYLTPPDWSSVSAYRSLITVDDELVMSQRIGVLYYDNAVHAPTGPPFQVYAPVRPPNAAPYLNTSSESWMYSAIWDNVYALGPPATGTPVNFPWDAIPTYFGTCGTGDADSSCRPKVLVLVITTDTWKHMDTNVDNTNLFVLVVGSPHTSDKNNIINKTGVPDGRIAFFSTGDEVETSGIFQDMVAQLQASTFEFVAPVVPAVRTTDNNRLYIASFTPATGSGSTRALWPGHLYSFDLNPDGSIPNPVVTNWDAASRLASRSPSTRNIYTTDNTSRLVFSTSTSALTYQMLGVASSERDNLINTVRSLRLGDIFHSTPVVVGAPSRYFADVTGIEARLGFVDTYAHRKRVIVAGANDGMLHAFNAGNWNAGADPPEYSAGTGDEEWAYIPGFLLPNLKNFTTLSTHEYYVDSAAAVADIWVDTTPPPSAAAKLATEWHTVVIGGVGKGGKGYYALDITNPLDTNYPAFRWELTNDSAHADRKYIGQTWSTPAIGKYQKIVTSGGNDYAVDQWVAIVGGGMGVPSGNGTITGSGITLPNGSGSYPYTVSSLSVNSTGSASSSGSITLKNTSNKTATGVYSSKTATSFDNVVFQFSGNDRTSYPIGTLVSWGGGTNVEGRAIFILDPWNGTILQRLSDPGMGNVVAPPTILTDSFGYISRVYVGDLRGNIWRATVDNTSNWALGATPQPFFTIGGTTYSKSIYTKASVSSGIGGYWIAFGTGDRENPMDVASGSNGAVFMVKDADAFTRRGMTTTTITESALQNESAFLSAVYNNNLTPPFTALGGTMGWYGSLGGGSATTGEKMLSAPALFNNNIYFTTFEPEASSCQVGGTARIYGFGMLTGMSSLYSSTAESSGATPDVRVRTFTSAGIPSSPVISVSSEGVATLYFGTTGSTVKSLKIPSPSSSKTLKYWHEVR